MINTIRRKICIFLINLLFSGTHFFKLKAVLLNLSGIKFGINSKLVGPITIGSITKVSVGSNTWIGADVKFYGNGLVKIGDFCDVAPEVAFLTGSHQIASNHQKIASRSAGKGVKFNIFVEDGCWIGARTSITGNVTIKKRSIVGAMSLVNKSVSENLIVAGVPARKIREIR